MKDCAYFAEGFGTFTLVLIGAGAASLGMGGLTGIALAHGLVLIAMGAAVGPTSGAHFNPSVTLAMALRKSISWAVAFRYMLAQTFGGVVAAYLLSYILGDISTDLGATLPNGQISHMAAFTLEAILTMFLVFVILKTSRNRDNIPTNVAAGLTLTFCIMMAGPLTGASLNFARSFGPALASGSVDTLWIYLLAPFTGSIAASLMDQCNRCSGDSCSSK